MICLLHGNYIINVQNVSEIRFFDPLMENFHCKTPTKTWCGAETKTTKTQQKKKSL